MTASADTAQPQYLTTREVADLLRVKERKVYDLAAAGEIPHRRITGKLLFPSAEIVSWIERGAGSALSERPPVVTGSHDPLLDWALRESGAALATMYNGSMAGLQTFLEGRAALAGLHVPEGGTSWNLGTVAAKAPAGSVLIAWAGRQRGVLLARNLQNDIRRFADLRGKRVVMRQPGAGAATLWDALAAEHGLTEGDFVPAGGVARTEGEAAAAVAAGEADAGLGLQAMALQYDLGFLPLVQERFDILVDRRAYFTDPVQTLLSFAQTGSFRAKAVALGGYDLAGLGDVRWLGA